MDIQTLKTLATVFGSEIDGDESGICDTLDEIKCVNGEIKEYLQELEELEKNTERLKKKLRRKCISYFIDIPDVLDTFIDQQKISLDVLYSIPELLIKEKREGGTEILDKITSIFNDDSRDISGWLADIKGFLRRSDNCLIKCSTCKKSDYGIYDKREDCIYECHNCKASRSEDDVWKDVYNEPYNPIPLTESEKQILKLFKEQGDSGEVSCPSTCS